MPYIKYTEYKPRGDAADLIRISEGILLDYEKQGFSLTLRQLYYQLVSRAVIPNNVRSYTRLGNIISSAREAGMLDWDHIKDRAREVRSFSHWDSPADIIDTCARQFRIDLWKDQPTRVEVFVEKQALEDVVGRAAREYDVPYFANKGYLSATSLWEAAHNRFLPYAKAGQKIVVLHLGDHDCSGIDMSRDIRDRLDLFATPYRKDQVRPDIEVIRIALNMDQVEQYSPPPNPAKETDSRFASYSREFGDESWELDALEPAVIVELIVEHIHQHMNQDLFEEAKARQEEYKQQLQDVSVRWDEVIEYIGEQ